MNAADDSITPPGVVMRMPPLIAPLGTVAVICVSLLTVNDGWFVQLNDTAVAPVKPVPVMTTGVPTRPLVGLMVALGSAPLTTVNEADGGVIPLGVVTVIGPVLAPTGTEAWIWASLEDSTLAVVPLNATAVTPVKPEPETVTAEHSAPLPGLNPVMAASTANDVVLVPITPPVETEIGPEVAPLGTVVLICVSLSTVKTG